MCGICGLVCLDGRPADPDLLDAMGRAIAHRGPDGSGAWVAGGVALGHRRLSIIELSQAGDQPMGLRDGSYRVICNGELYNYIELRTELEQLGHRFESGSDIEVLLHAWQEWQEAALPRFRGMWAFAIWDDRQQRVTLSRDHYGIKPLYYTVQNGQLAFASEMKALLPVLTQRTPNLRTLYQLAVYQLRTDPTATCLQEIHQLAPGTLLRIEGGRYSTHQWYDPPTPEPREDITAGMLRELLEESVALHLRSDVRVGACLSGGLDSSGLVALAIPKLPYALRTYSVSYPGSAVDESGYVDAVLRHNPGAINLRATPDADDALDVLDRIVWHFEEPVWGEASYSWWKVMELVASDGTKVVVNGQGADELFAGYPYYYPSYLRELLRTGQVSRFRSELRAEAAHQSVPPFAMLRQILGPLLPGALRSGMRQFRTDHSWNDAALGQALRDAGPSSSTAASRREFWSLEAHLQSDFTTTRLPMLLQAEDRFSMAFGIESRVPFVSQPLVEFAATVPAHQKLHGGLAKVLLREAFEDLVPREVSDRTDKKGYPTPAANWYRGKLGAQVLDRLNATQFDATGLLELAEVRNRFTRFREGHDRRLPQIWRWLTIESWGRQFL